MQKRKGFLAGLLVLGLSVAGMMGTSVAAEEYYEYSGDYYDDGYYEEEYYEDYYEEPAAEEVKDSDNSLYSLGLNSSYTCSPDFVYNTLEYNVTVPAGTTKFDFDPVKSSSKAEITDVTGTTLDDKGNGTVEVTVKAENGAAVTYYLHVTSDAPQVAETEAQTEVAKAAEEVKEEETQSKKEIKKEKAALAAAESEKQVLESEKAELAAKIAQMEQKEEQVSLLQTENDDLAYRLDLLMKVLYGLVAFAVVLLFFIINQSLRNKDMKDDIKKARSELEDAKLANTADFYYAPVQQPVVNEQAEPVFVPAEQEEPVLSKKEQKKLEKEAKKAAKLEAKKARAAKKAAVDDVEEEPVFIPAPAPQEAMFEQIDVPEPQPVVEEPQPIVVEPQPVIVEPQPVSKEPQLVKGDVKETDIKVDMIEL